MGMSGKRVVCSAIAVVVCLGGLATPVLARGRHHHRRKVEPSSSVKWSNVEGGSVGKSANGSAGSTGTAGHSGVVIIPGQSPIVSVPEINDITSSVKNLLGPNVICPLVCTGAAGKPGGDGTAGASATGGDGGSSSGPDPGTNGADAVGGNGTAGGAGS